MKIQARNRGGVIHVQIGEVGAYKTLDFYPDEGSIPLPGGDQPSLAGSGRPYAKVFVSQDKVLTAWGAKVGVAKAPEAPKATVATPAPAPAKAKMPGNIKAALAKLSEAIDELADEDEDDE